MTKLWCVAFGFAFGLCAAAIADVNVLQIESMQARAAIANNVLAINDAFGVMAQIEAKKLPNGTYRIVCEVPQ